MIEGFGAGSVPLTNGSGSRTPKKIECLKKDCAFTTFLTTFFSMATNCLGRIRILNELTTQFRIHNLGLRVRGSGSVKNIYRSGTLVSTVFKWLDGDLKKLVVLTVKYNEIQELSSKLLFKLQALWKNPVKASLARHLLSNSLMTGLQICFTHPGSRIPVVPARQPCSLACRYDNPMSVMTLSRNHGSMNSTTVWTVDREVPAGHFLHFHPLVETSG